MPENTNELFNGIIIALAVLCSCLILYKIFHTHIKDRYAPIQTVKARVADKFVADKFSKIHGTMAKNPQHFIVFSIGNRKRSFRVSEFSYQGYKINQRGTLKFKGTRLIDFH